MTEPTLLTGEGLSALAPPLIAWYRANARSLPWRADATPYHVWLSEVMLQQTRIEAVKPYYARFLAAAPTIAALAALPDEQLMKLWEGLGYYSRARNLKRAARAVIEKHNGEMPKSYEALLALPGIGEYTAGAIASIAYDLPVPAVDGNVLRVVARLTGDRADVLAPATKKRITAALATAYRDACCRPGDAAALTQGLMELGEVVCVPNRAPDCGACPLAALCRAREEGSYTEIPYRAPKKEKKPLYKLVLLLCDREGNYAIRRRPEEGLLAGLWELPSVDLPSGRVEEDEALDALAREFCLSCGLTPAESVAAPDARHIFTHLVWHMQARYVNVEKTKMADPTLHFVSPNELKTAYALPSAFRAYTRVIYGEENG